MSHLDSFHDRSSRQDSTGGSAQQQLSADRSSVSVALGGGGARGISHLGVLRAIADSRYTIAHLTGISIGAIAGAMIAANPDPVAAQRLALDFLESPEFRRRRAQMFGLTPAQGYSDRPRGWIDRLRKLIGARKHFVRAFRSPAVLPEAVLQHVVDALLPDVAIEDLSLPFSAVAVDVLSGQRVVLDHGPLRDAVRASASIPGVFPPVVWEDKLLCDIGVYETVPALTAKQRPGELTVAVDVSDEVAPIAGCQNILEMIGRMQQLAEWELRHHSLSHADLIIRPDIGRRAWFDFEDGEALIACGYQEAQLQLESTSDLLVSPSRTANTLPIRQRAIGETA